MTNEEISDRDEVAGLIVTALDEDHLFAEDTNRPDIISGVWAATDAVLESIWLAETERRAWQHGLDEGRKIGIAQGHQSGLRESISHLRAGIHEEACEGIAKAIEAFCYLRDHGDDPCDAELHADIAREWLPS